MQDGICPAESTTPTACPIKHEKKRERIKIFLKMNDKFY